MAISKLILNGTTQMDLTSDTVAAASMLSGTTAHKNDGTSVTGSIASKTSSDVATSNNVVTIPAGHYASQVQKTVGTAQAAQTITPGTTDQTIASGKYLTGAQTILGDADLVAGNIKKDVQIFGVTGTYEGASLPDATGEYFGTPTAVIITFDIINKNSVTVTYQAEEGMTFSEWVSSEYNTGGYVIKDYTSEGYDICIGYVSGYSKYYVRTTGYVTVRPTDIINSSGYYCDTKVME